MDYSNLPINLGDGPCGNTHLGIIMSSSFLGDEGAGYTVEMEIQV